MKANGKSLALRSTLYRPNEIIEFAKIADEATEFKALFFPDVQGYDSFKLCALASGVTKRIKIGSGVIRLLEHGPAELLRSIGTLQFISSDRFILGVGTGNPGQKPIETIEKMLVMLDETRESFGGKYPNSKIPEIYVGALRRGIASRVIGKVDGLILNFCSPEYASNFVASLKTVNSLEGKTVACYIKVFYSREEKIAERLLVDEFASYNKMPSYHKMFERDGVASDIARAQSEKSGQIPESMLRTSLANPSSNELDVLVQEFREGGVNLPCIYPYFQTDEDSAFKRQTIKSIVGV